MRNTILSFVALASLAACTSAQGFVPSQITQVDQAVQKQALMRALRDPSSAQVEDVRVYQSPNGNRMVCSKVNGRKAFGAYAGFQTLMVMQVAGVDYSKSYINPTVALGGVGTLDCAGAGYPV